MRSKSIEELVCGVKMGPDSKFVSAQIDPSSLCVFRVANGRPWCALCALEPKIRSNGDTLLLARMSRRKRKTGTWSRSAGQVVPMDLYGCRRWGRRENNRHGKAHGGLGLAGPLAKYKNSTGRPLTYYVGRGQGNLHTHCMASIGHSGIGSIGNGWVLTGWSPRGRAPSSLPFGQR